MQERNLLRPEELALGHSVRVTVTMVREGEDRILMAVGVCNICLLIT